MEPDLDLTLCFWNDNDVESHPRILLHFNQNGEEKAIERPAATVPARQMSYQNISELFRDVSLEGVNSAFYLITLDTPLHRPNYYIIPKERNSTSTRAIKPAPMPATGPFQPQPTATRPITSRCSTGSIPIHGSSSSPCSTSVSKSILISACFHPHFAKSTISLLSSETQRVRSCSPKMRRSTAAAPVFEPAGLRPTPRRPDRFGTFRPRARKRTERGASARHQHCRVQA